MQHRRAPRDPPPPCRGERIDREARGCGTGQVRFSGQTAETGRVRFLKGGSASASCRGSTAAACGGHAMPAGRTHRIRSSRVFIFDKSPADRLVRVAALRL
jgi:hypothetical protein